MSENEYLVPGLDIQKYSPETGGQAACFCCGVCCHLRVFMSLEQAQRIAADRGIPIEDFLELTAESDNYGQEIFRFGVESYLLKQKDGFCIFLKEKEGTNGRFCSIHHIEPDMCGDWAASFYRPECQQGLSLRWNLHVDEVKGVIRGPDTQLQQFESFMDKLNNGTLFDD